MKPGELVRVVKNDMSLIIRKPGPKDNMFFNQIGTIIKKHVGRLYNWYDVLLPSGLYEAREDALAIVGEDFNEEKMWKMWGDI